MQAAYTLSPVRILRAVFDSTGGLTWNRAAVPWFKDAADKDYRNWYVVVRTRTPHTQRHSRPLSRPVASLAVGQDHFNPNPPGPSPDTPIEIPPC